MGIIEGDQIEVAAFSLEYFAYLTGPASNSARARRWIQIGPCFLPIGYMLSGAITASVIIGCDQPSQICKILKRKTSCFSLATFDNTLFWTENSHLSVRHVSLRDHANKRVFRNINYLLKSHIDT